MLAALPATAALVVGGGKSLGILPSGMVGRAVPLAGWLFLSNPGLVRWLVSAVAVAAPVFVIVLDISRQLLWEAGAADLLDFDPLYTVGDLASRRLSIDAARWSAWLSQAA